MGILLIVLLAGGTVGSVWLGWWAETTWRTTDGKIASIEGKVLVPRIIGKLIIDVEVTDLHVSYAWNHVGYTVSDEVDGWQWNAGQTVSVVVDRTNGNLISCC